MTPGLMVPVQYAAVMSHRHLSRPILTVGLLSVGSELTVGDTKDTNAPELAHELTARGVRVTGIHALPDDLATVRGAFGAALRRADIVISTGGLGPTPDDLTREAIAAAVGEEPDVDPEIEAWLRGLWKRRRMPFPEINLKQAWVIPSATAIPNANGTAPGWWVDRPDGRVVVALPGPPREMRPMWRDWVVPRLEARGIGRGQVVRTLRLFGIGESQAANLLGEALLRASNPIVATYARTDAVDVRISATDLPGQAATDIAARAEAAVRAAIGDHIWGGDGDTWPSAIGAELEALGWTVATTERGTDGALVALLGGLDRVLRGEVVRESPDVAEELGTAAARVRDQAGADVGLAVRAGDRGEDTGVSIAVALAGGVHEERQVAFLRGELGRSRAALNAASTLLRVLRAQRPAAVEAISDGQPR
jgi:nicotinamide-nucleotide amidase